MQIISAYENDEEKIENSLCVFTSVDCKEGEKRLALIAG